MIIYSVHCFLQEGNTNELRICTASVTGKNAPGKRALEAH